MTPPPPERRPRRRPAPASIGRWVRTRIYVAGALVTLLFAGIAYSAYGLQVGQAEHFRQLSRQQHVRTIEIPAPRGVIYDVTGRELAVTADASSISAHPRQVVDVFGTAEALAQILGADVRDLEARLAQRRYFVWIKRHVTEAEAEAVRAAGLAGVEVVREPRRFYPGRGLAGPVLGFAGIDGRGFEGIELRMDELLRGKLGTAAALRDAVGNVLMAEGLAEPTPGASITLTIDRAIQFIAEQALAAAVAEHQAKAGTIVVIDVATGEVLAMANWPTYDPNRPGRIGEARNRAVTDAYEIGSVMKIFTVIAALDAGVVRPDETFDIENGRMRIGRKMIRDTYRDEELTVGGIIKRSSNVGSVKIARRLGAEAMHEALLRYGFGSRTGIELPGERAGYVPPPRRWGEIGLATMSYGYGMSTTPLQVAAALAAVGNGGVYHEPRIIRRVTESDGTVVFEGRAEGRRVMEERSARAMLPMLESVFDKGRYGGTARSLDVPDFRVGGKTGTSHKLSAQGKGYSEDRYLSSFAGLAPAKDPRIAVVVLIDEPGGEEYYGGRVAGPAFVSVVVESLRYLGLPPDRPPAPRPAVAVENDPGEPEPVPLVDVDEPEEPLGHDVVRVPDFAGMSIARVLDEARRAGLTCEITGAGRAVAQAPPPGAARKFAECRVVFSLDEGTDGSWEQGS